jgi:hypothetical protein
VSEDDLSDPLWFQLFSIRRSQRYHERRTTFFERLHRITDLTAILLAGIVVMELAGAESPGYIKVFAVLGALLSATDLVVGFSRRAESHRVCRNNFIDLETAVLRGSVLEDVVENRLRLEKAEPSIYRALDVLCHNEMCIAMKCEGDRKKLPLLLQLTAHFWQWPDAGSLAKAATVKPPDSP